MVMDRFQLWSAGGDHCSLNFAWKFTESSCRILGGKYCRFRKPFCPDVNNIYLNDIIIKKGIKNFIRGICI